MSLFLSMSGRARVEDMEDLVQVTESPDAEPVHLDMNYFRVPNDAAILKQYSPLFISCNGAKPQFLWACREFEPQGYTNTFPAYIVSGFGLLDAFMHAYATNGTLVLHPLDIILSVCYGYGNERKKPIYHNNQELKMPVQVVLKQEFKRSNLLLALVARLARRVESFPLPKLYSLINTELSSPDPIVIRVVLGVLSYLASTKEATRLTLDLFKDVYNLYNHNKVDQLNDSQTQLWSGGTLDVRHDPNMPSNCKKDNKDKPNQETTKIDLDEESIFATSAVALGLDIPVHADAALRPSHYDSSKQDALQKPSPSTRSAAQNASAGSGIFTPAAEAAAASTDGGFSEELKIHGNWRLMFDKDTADMKSEARRRAEGQVARSEAPVEPESCALEALTVLSSDAVDENSQPGKSDANRSNFIEEQEAFEWFLKPRFPSRQYKFRKENGIHSVLFKGSQRAWVELPETLHELCQFFMLDLRLQSEIVKIGQYLQRTRLNTSPGQNFNFRKWWQKVLFKDGLAEALPDGDIMITGWLATLLGARVINESCPMTINKLSDLKTGVRLPMMLIRQPVDCKEETDDSVLDFESGRLKMIRLNYYDEYSEKMGNSSSNAGEIPIGLFMPWRSFEVLNRSRKLWRQVGGDTPTTLRPRKPVKTTVNRNNIDKRVDFRSMSDQDTRFHDDDASVKLWTPKRQSSAGGKSNACSCCGKRSRRRLNEVTEPMYNMSCLLTGLGGFCLQERNDIGATVRRMCVRPLCFLDIAYEE